MFYQCTGAAPANHKTKKTIPGARAWSCFCSHMNGTYFLFRICSGTRFPTWDFRKHISRRIARAAFDYFFLYGLRAQPQCTGRTTNIYRFANCQRTLFYSCSDTTPVCSATVLSFHPTFMGWESVFWRCARMVLRVHWAPKPLSWVDSVSWHCTRMVLRRHRASKHTNTLGFTGIVNRTILCGSPSAPGLRPH